MREGSLAALGGWEQGREVLDERAGEAEELRGARHSDREHGCAGGFPEAIQTLHPQTEVQLCIVHMVRDSLRYVSWKEHKEVANDLRSIYTTPTAKAAQTEPTEFGQKWNGQFPSISRSWRERWENVTSFFA